MMMFVLGVINGNPESVRRFTDERLDLWYNRRYIRSSPILVTDTIELLRSDRIDTDDLHKEWIRECGVREGHGAQENGEKKS